MMSKLAAAAMILSVALPLGLAAAMLVRALRPVAMRIAPWAAAPALLLGIALPFDFEVDARWLLLGLRLEGADHLTRAFLTVTAILWLVAGWFARTYLGESRHRDSFWLFFLVTAAGNIGLIVAQDVASFYVFYALMTFAAYGLVLHERTDDARRAGRVYLAMAVVAEAMLLVAFLLVVRQRVNIPLSDVPRAALSSPDRDLALGLLLAGFGVKAGAVPLHFWLPLAHPVAPAPASAVLSGAIIKAGLLGWLRFLPLGLAALETHGLLCLGVGLLSALYGAAIGVTQTDPKTVLAYSSVSQMGFVTATLGIALIEPTAAAAARTAIVLFAAHHAFAKGSLFLGTAVATSTGRGWPCRLVTIGLVVPALAIAGAPLSSGALAKLALKDVVMQTPFGSMLSSLFSIAAVGSTLLMLRFLSLSLPRRTSTARAPSSGLWVPWALLVAGGPLLLLLLAFRSHVIRRLVQLSALGSAAWPIVAGCALGWIATRASRRRTLRLPTIPAGDIVVLVEKAARWTAAPVRLARQSIGRFRRAALPRLRRDLAATVSTLALERIERRLGHFEVLGLFMLLVFMLVMFAPALLRH